MNDHDAMLAIQQELDGVEWSSDTVAMIASIVIAAGYRVRDIDDEDADLIAALRKAVGGARHEV